MITVTASAIGYSGGNFTLRLKRGIVALCDHKLAWNKRAASAIRDLKGLVGDLVLDIQYMGSTAIRHIKAKLIRVC